MDYSKIRSNWWSGTCYHKQQLDEIITSTDVHKYAYILHDKDKQPNSEELKKPHYHFLVHFEQPQRGSWFKAFSTDDMGLVFIQRCSIPKSAYDYLIHDTPACKKEGKHLYDASERISTIESLDAPEQAEEDEHVVLYNDIMELVNKQITWHELIKRKPKRIHMISNIKTAYDLLAREHKFDNIFRNIEVIYIYGQTGTGKTKFVVDKYGYQNIYRVTKYNHTAFDGYKGQDVIVFEEFREQIKIDEMLIYLDGHPADLPSRYNNKGGCYTKVYILTNWSFEKQYASIKATDKETYEAFMRRITEIYNFDESKTKPIYTKKPKNKQLEMDLTKIPINDKDLPWQGNGSEVKK